MSCQCLVQMGIMTYYQLNKEYIAEVLCINREKPELHCNGSCFLKEKLQENAPASAEEFPATQQQRIEIPSFLVTHYQFKFQSYQQTAQKLPLFMPSISIPLISFAVFHPPRA